MANLNTLGQTKVPRIFAKIQKKGLCDLMSVYAETKVKDAGGATATSRTLIAEDVPVLYKPNNVGGFNRSEGDRRTVPNEYMLSFPVIHEDERINVDANTRFIVAERGMEPEKTFTVKNIGNNAGVVYKVLCELV